MSDQESSIPMAVEASRQKVYIRWLPYVLSVVCLVTGLLIGYFTAPRANPQTTDSQKISKVPLSTPQPSTEPMQSVATFPLSQFQQGLATNCKVNKDGVGTIAVDKLPVTLDKAKLEVQIDNTVACFYNSETHTYWVEFPVFKNYSAYNLEIYDRLSEKVMGMGVLSFNYHEPERYSDTVSYGISYDMSDAPPPIEDASASVYAVKSLLSKNYEQVYVRLSRRVIPSGDKRFMNMLMKYKRIENDNTEKPQIDEMRLSEVDADIQKTFFSNLNKLQEPEKTNFYSVIHALESISP